MGPCCLKVLCRLELHPISSPVFVRKPSKLKNRYALRHPALTGRCSRTFSQGGSPEFWHLRPSVTKVGVFCSACQGEACTCPPLKKSRASRLCAIVVIQAGPIASKRITLDHPARPFRLTNIRARIW